MQLPSKTIKSINLSNNPKLDVSCLIELFTSQNTKLKSLNLSNTDICLLDLYLSMSKNPSCYLSLHELNVANCQLKKKSGLFSSNTLTTQEEDNISYLFQSQQLAKVDLSGVKISLGCLKKFLQAMANRSRLGVTSSSMVSASNSSEGNQQNIQRPSRTDLNLSNLVFSNEKTEDFQKICGIFGPGKSD